MLNMLRFKYPKITTRPESSKNGGGSPVEQTTEPDQNYDNHENEIPQHISDDDENTQKTQKEPNISSVDDTQKTPRESPKQPIARKTHKYTW